MSEYEYVSASQLIRAAAAACAPSWYDDERRDYYALGVLSAFLAGNAGKSPELMREMGYDDPVMYFACRAEEMAELDKRLAS